MVYPERPFLLFTREREVLLYAYAPYQPGAIICPFFCRKIQIGPVLQETEKLFMDFGRA
jgi:hypothetical protein